MGIKTTVRELNIEKRKMTIAVEIVCQMTRPAARAPRIELVFRNDYDNRRMVLPCQSFLPMDKGDGSLWIAKAKYRYALSSVFWYGTWKTCHLTFDIDFDGHQYETVPFELDLRKMDLDDKNPETEDSDYIHEENKDQEPDEERVKTDSFKVLRDNEIEITAGSPVIINPPKQADKLQVVLALLLRFFNQLISLLFFPWYILDSLAVMFLPTEVSSINYKINGFWKTLFALVISRHYSFCRKARGINDVKDSFSLMIYRVSNAFHSRKKSILFLSNRRSDLSGNFKYIDSYLKDNSKLKIDYWMNDRIFYELSTSEIFSVSWKCGKARIILLDDYCPYIRRLLISRETMVVQIWHACGALKYTGFSKIGKKKAAKQNNRGHRDYRYCFISSVNASKYYQEAFGISSEKVIALGTPKTDLYFDDLEKSKRRDKLFRDCPDLSGKKIILFAPTFRGLGKVDAHYDEARFDPNKVAKALGDDAILVIHHHPFVSQDYAIEESLKGRIIDLSHSCEAEDLLLITDVLITDYSSILYDASLLDIPMLFYAYDLEEYIHDTGLYFEYERNVPGKIVYTQEDLIKALLDNDYEKEKVQPFRLNNFEYFDGKSSQRVASFIEGLALHHDSLHMDRGKN